MKQDEGINIGDYAICKAKPGIYYIVMVVNKISQPTVRYMVRFHKGEGYLKTFIVDEKNMMRIDNLSEAYNDIGSDYYGAGIDRGDW